MINTGKRNNVGCKRNVPIKFLICSLLCLDPHNNFFKKINLKFHLNSANGINAKNVTLHSTTSKQFSIELYNLLNKPSIRQIAFTLIKPILPNTNKLDLQYRQNKYYKQGKLLKKYLKKFRLVYKRYFLIQPGELNQKTIDKEINNLALQALFLIVGL